MVTAIGASIPAGTGSGGSPVCCTNAADLACPLVCATLTVERPVPSACNVSVFAASS
jgi:hypothetical protein